MRLLLLMPLLLITVGCKKQPETFSSGKCTVACGRARVYIGLYGYSPDETDTMLLRAYAGVADTGQLASEQQVNKDYLSHRLLTPDTNYILIIPATKASYHIRDLFIDYKEQEFESRHCTDNHCFSYPHGILVNDEPANVALIEESTVEVRIGK